MSIATIISGATLVLLTVALLIFSKKPNFPVIYSQVLVKGPGPVIVLLPVIAWAIYIKFFNINYSFLAESPKIVLGVIIATVLSLFAIGKT